MPPALSLGPVGLVVSDLCRAVGFYERSLGLGVHFREGRRALLGVEGRELLVLDEDPQAGAGRHAGLFHFALLFPSREELARAVLRLGATRTALSGASDHGVSEAIYLSDPEGNGIELYADRPRESWPEPDLPGARVGMYTVALDLESLLAAAPDGEPAPTAPAGLRMGHVHLRVGELAGAAAFHHGTVGFEPMVSLPGAEFLAAGGYHHHLGLNSWGAEGIPPAPRGARGVRRWNVLLDSPEEVARVRERVEASGAPVEGDGEAFEVRDPAGIAVAFSAGA